MDEIPKMSTEWELRSIGLDYVANTLPDAPSWGGEYYMRSWRAMCGCDEICPAGVKCPC